MELRNVLFTTSSLKSKDNEGYNMILVFMEHYGPNAKHKHNEGLRNHANTCFKAKKEVYSKLL